MSIEALPMGMRCNKECRYCYQTPVRTAGNEGQPRYSLEAMKRALEAEGYKFSVFGGEPLLMPIDDLAELFRWGHERFGGNSIQTHGALITDAHLRLFRKYQVGVGLSIDGPGELNDAREEGTLEQTRAATERSLSALDRLLQRKHPVSLIVTLHRVNASPERLPRLVEWFRQLASKGLTYVNLHLLEVDMPGVRETLALSESENVDALMTCARLQAEIPITFNPLSDMVRLLKGEDEWDGGGVNCTWNACDPYTTAAVHGVDGQGNRGNCGRTCKEGPFWVKADRAGYERYLALAHTPQAYGGCQGCRFFYACKGNCPGEGLEGDWRSKTEHCSVLMRVFEALEADLVRSGITPLSLSADRAGVEANLLAAWQSGSTLSVTRAREYVRTAATYQPSLVPVGANRPHGDAPHGDAPHGDHTDVANPHVEHGDHTDSQGRVAWASL